MYCCCCCQHAKRHHVPSNGIVHCEVQIKTPFCVLCLHLQEQIYFLLQIFATCLNCDHCRYAYFFLYFAIYCHDLALAQWQISAERAYMQNVSKLLWAIC